ncbi:MAG: hypothetical protein KJ732_06605 [Candidatus Margulisbacteria bacterium]|nr:hypothetical protein [Candidatus Margulisiibacteriota bacterium]
MLKSSVVFLLLISLLVPATTQELTFKQMSPLLQKAILDKDMAVLQKHIDLYGIIKSKIHTLSQKAQQKKSFRYKILGKTIGLSESILAKLASEVVIKEFKITPRAVRKRYLDQLKIEGIGQQGRQGYAFGAFMGKPFHIAAIKTKGKWLIIGVESEIIDQEMDYLLKALSRRK